MWTEILKHLALIAAALVSLGAVAWVCVIVCRITYKEPLQPRCPDCGALLPWGIDVESVRCKKTEKPGHGNDARGGW